MNTLTVLVALNETSYNVAALHKTLEVLGLPVVKEEVEQHRAGPDTVRQMRALQRQLGVAVDRSVLVDDETAAAVEAALKERGLTAAGRSFTVSGAVKFQDGAAKKGQRLLAFEIGLRGVAAYGQVETLAEVEENGGFTFVSQTTSDRRGDYSLTFYDWQYRRPERGKAGVVVFAVEEDVETPRPKSQNSYLIFWYLILSRMTGSALTAWASNRLFAQSRKRGGHITGRSRLVNSDESADGRPVRGLDVAVTRTDTQTEYETLTGALDAFLKEGGVSLRELAASPEQLAFAAGELDIEPSRLALAAAAASLNTSGERRLSHELLYGIGRQDIQLEWPALYRKQEAELRAAIVKSVSEGLIREQPEETVTAFLQALRESAARQLLDGNLADGGALDAMLSNALPEKAQRLSFLNAVATFEGSDFREFWGKHLPAQPEFKDKPELVSSLLLTQQLALLTGEHQALINELQVSRKIDSARRLFDLEHDDWVTAVRKTGVPDFVEGASEEERVQAYAGLMRSSLDAAFPTRRIEKMAQRRQLPVEEREVAEGIAGFLSKTAHFDFATSRVHDFGAEIEAAAGRNSAGVKSELMKIQRVFQVSTTPEAMTALMRQNLNSAYAIANIPQKSFIETYAEELGGEAAAFAIHQRASHISTRTEMAATHMMEYAQGATPAYALGHDAQKQAMAVLQDQIPNYAELFGSPDLCECEHCRSVYSAAAYFVDLLRFLWRSKSNGDTPQRTPLDVLAERRPDLLHLHLTCENTNTVIPYIDLVNEVMEHYAANNSLSGFEGHDTGEATATELRANPQNFNLAAYGELKKAKYPFTLPYHQPLDVIRTYGGHLKVSRYEVLKAANPQPSYTTASAIAAESLLLSEEEYAILTGHGFNGQPDATTSNEYFGYAASATSQLEGLRPVREFMRRSGIAYTDLVELVKTRFVNPFKGTLDFLQKIFGPSQISSDLLYTKLVQIAAGTLDPANDPQIMAALTAYNSAPGDDITAAKFAQWVNAHLSKFRQVITLYEPDSRCNLDTTELRTIKSIYDKLPDSGIADTDWSKMHRFIRLWRKLGWTIHETDLMLAAIGESDITPAAISKLEPVLLLKAATKLPLNQLAVFWGNIDAHGDKSLYRKLFLNKAAQQIDPAFQADAEGDYLQDDLQVLAVHLSAILASFQLRAEDLDAILKVAQVIDIIGGTSSAPVIGPRAIDVSTDALSLGNLSTIYRYVLLAKTLKMSVGELCKLIALFGTSPFPVWDIQQEKFVNVAPGATYEFYKLALSTKEAGFKPSVLEYITQGTFAADSKIGLGREKSLQTARVIRDAFAAVEQNHPETAPSPLTPELLAAKLTLTFQPEVVTRFMQILDGTAAFETLTDPNLGVTLPGFPLSPLVSAETFLDLAGLVTRLTTHVDAVSNYLWNKFSTLTQLELNDPQATPAKQRLVLIKELNDILTGGSIYDVTRFAAVTLSAGTLALMSQNPQGAALTRLNRLLLEDAYPSEIAKTPVSEKYAYVKGSGRLTCAGVMSDDERATLKSLANITPAFEDAVDRLYAAPAKFIAAHFGGVFSDLPAAYLNLLDLPAQPTPATLEAKLSYVYDHFVPILKSKLRRDAITQHVAALIGLGEESTALLIADDVESLVTGLSTAGYSASYRTATTNWQPFVPERTDGTVDFSWKLNAPDPLLPADKFGMRWEAYLATPASGEYTLVVDVEGADDDFRLFLDDTLLLSKTNANTSAEVMTTLNAARMHSLKLEYEDATQSAGVRLQWKTATKALEVVPASVAYPTVILDWFVERANVYHRAAKFILGFRLDDTEVNNFINYGADFDNIDFGALDLGDWKRVYDYTVLRDAVPQAQASLTDVLALAHTVDSTHPPAFVDDLRHLLHLATAWDETSLQFLTGAHFSLGRADFRNEIALNRLRALMDIVSRTGLSAQTVAAWGAAVTSFSGLAVTAQLMKNTVRAKYEERDWLELAADLNNTLRENQKQALVAYLLTNPNVRAWGAKDADGLFEYLLIDVQMGACMDTSRIVAANSSVQMFVNRCLLNLESRTSGGPEKGVSPAAIDKARWEWMKNYRVWEANRKVFLYPENWLEPDWRNDRSEFFKDLESYLVQNDITERSVEQAFRDYLASLNEVANLEVCGIHKESHADGRTFKYLHVFARTHNAPYKFFYRRWNEAQKWGAWEKMPLDIRCIEQGDDSGVHLVPLVWKNRLFLFWPEFIKVQEPPDSGGESIKAAFNSETPISARKAVESWEIRLAWSEHVDGKWSPKQLSKEFVKIRPDRWGIPSESKLRWVYLTGPRQELEIRAHFLDPKPVFPGGQTLPFALWHELGTFRLSDITSKVETDNPPTFGGNGWKGYELSFMNYAKRGKLQLANDDYLNAEVSHKVLVTPTRQDYVQRLTDPFFFSDSLRTYFVRPVDITFIEWVQQPDRFAPALPGLVANAQNGPATLDAQSPAAMTVPGVGGALGQPVNTPNTGAGSVGAQSGGVTAMQHAGAATATVGAVASSQGLGAEMTYTEAAFGGALTTVFSSWTQTTRKDRGLEFHTFYHPFSGRYVENLNRDGLPGLMQSDTKIASDDGATFENAYQPNLANGFVQKPSDFPARTYYKENVCFDVYGANSLYNWELFFHAPLYIATRLSKNGKYEEALKWFHYIFDPTTDEMPAAGETAVSRYWKVPPFKTAPKLTIEEWFRDLSTNPVKKANIAEWRNHPFDPHLIASNRPLAYMKRVVMSYVENLIAWGDSLFRQDTMESVNEALQIYVIANHILGPRPEAVPKRGEIKAESFHTLQNKLDDFSNALVELENVFPFSGPASVSQSSGGTNLMGVGSALYFCIPPNEKLLGYWDTAADRLYKIRHCQNIDGVERHLALFSPPIDPAALIQAASQGLSLGSILADLSSPPPIYRFSFLIQKANEFCADVKALGSALLAAVEKKDAEELGRLRASQEAQMLELMTAIKERQVLDAKAGRENLVKAREAAAFRLQHYIDLLGNESVNVPASPTIGATLTADSQLPADTNIATVVTDVDETLVDASERGVKLIQQEKAQLEKSSQAMVFQQNASGMEGLAGIMNAIPNFSVEGAPYGVGAGVSYGGSNIGGSLSGFAKVPQILSSILSHEATLAATMASYVRREQEQTLLANLAAREIVQLDKQVTSADIRVQMAEKELENHRRQIENAKATEQFLKNKFTNQELYQWMKEQLFAVYKQSYYLAYDMARKAEKAYKYETGSELASFIQYGYWDNSKQGLVAGEKLQLALRQLEKSYLEENRREFELSKSISLARLDPLALIQLRETGACRVSVPEEWFDLDFRGHYFRRLRGVRLSIPCVVGPYASVSCSLRLLSNSIRVNPTLKGGQYEHENDAGLWIDDDRFRTNHVPVTAIATSTAQNDSGMFEFNFRDERYLPFERAGAISEWQIELSTEKALRQFDYSTISDVILHLDYTARESGGLFKEKATAYLRDFFITNHDELEEQPFTEMFAMRHEFSTEWYRFLHPAITNAEQELTFTLGKERFPFFVQDKEVVVMKLQVLARCTPPKTYQTMISYEKKAPGGKITSSDINMVTKSAYDKLNIATIDATDTKSPAGSNLAKLDITRPMTIKLKRNLLPPLPTSAVPVPDYGRLIKEPPEVEEIYLVVHYKLA